MDDAIDDAMASDEDEDEEEAIVAQVMDELGIEISETLADAPSGSLISSNAEASTDRTPVAADADSDLQARLNNLRRE